MDEVDLSENYQQKLHQILAANCDHFEAGQHPFIEAELFRLIKQARNNEIEALVTHIQDKFEEVEVLLNEYQYVRTRAIDKEGDTDD